MKSESQVLQEDLHALACEREVTERLWKQAVETAESHRKRAVSEGVSVPSTAEDDAGDFLIHLADRSPVALKAITSRSMLHREYRKWIVDRCNPSSKELWEVVSRALLALEREGEVVRAVEFRRFNNSNKTRWSLAENEGVPGCLLAEEEVESVKPSLSKKSDKRRLLNPGEAKRWLVGLLGLAKGEVSMQDLFHSLKANLSVFEEIPGEDLSPENDEGDEGASSWLNRFCAAQIAPDLEAAVEEDIEYAVSCIWKGAATIRHGSNPVVEGLRILCCYWLPKNVYDKKVTLKDFGHTSTVNDVANDLSRMMAQYVPFPERVEADDSDRLACLRVASGIIEAVSDLCSENGYCRCFDV